MNNNEGLVYLIRLLLSWKKSLIATIVLALAGSIIVAYLLPVYFQGSCIFYVYSPKSYDPKYLFAQLGAADAFGSGDDIDRAITLGNSSKVVGAMVRKYNLKKRYDIDSTGPQADLQVSREFRGNLSISENDRSAVVINVLDRNPDTAALIANDIMNEINELSKQAIIETTQSQLEKYEADLVYRKKLVDSILTGLNEKKELFNQSRLAAQKAEIDVLLREAQTRLAILKSGDMQTLYVVEKAYPVYKKTKPVRWMIVVLSVMGTFMMFSTYIIFRDYYLKKIKNQA